MHKKRAKLRFAKLRLKLNRDLASKGETMALYTIGEVALLCDINPVTLRAWQRRYGLLKPQRTDGGHRLFNDADIDRIREIKRWIDNGVQVSKVKMLLSNENVDVQNGWRDQQETLLTYLQSGNLHSLRTWIKERGQDYPAQTLTTHLFIPLRRRLQCQQPTLQTLLAILDGVLINYISICTASARKNRVKMHWWLAGIFRIPLVCGWRAGLPVNKDGALMSSPTRSINYALNCSKAVHCWCGAVIIEPPPNSSNSPVGKNKAMIFSHSAFNDSLTNALYCTILSLT